MALDRYEYSVAAKATVPVLMKLKSTLHVIGTAILTKISSCTILITAAHVIKGSRKYHAELGIMGRNSKFVTIEGEWVCSGQQRYGTMEDPIDVAAIKLSHSSYTQFTGDGVFLDLEHMELSDCCHEGRCWLLGYPVCFLELSCKAKEPMGVRSILVHVSHFTGSTNLVSDYKRQLHLLFKAQEMGATKETQEKRYPLFGQAEPFSTFHSGLVGLSGGGVWRLGDETLSGAKCGVPAEKIVALQTGVYSKLRVIKATRWSAVMAFLGESFPELGPVLQGGGS